MWQEYRTKIERLLVIVKAIKENEGLKREDLARLCGGVSKQTISNYLETLRKMGYPIVFNHENNGFELYRQDFVDLENSFAQDELLLLLLALDSIKNFSRKDINDLKNKLLNFLPEKSREDFRKVVREMDTYPTIDEGSEFISLAKIHEAIIKEQFLNINYSSANSDGVKKEEVLPYTVVWQRDKCYLIAEVNEYDWPINYRLDRVKNVEVIEKQGKIPESFDLESYMARTWRMFSGPPVNVVLKFSNDIKTLVEDNFHADYREIVQKTGDKFLLKATIRGLKGLKIWILSLGEKVEVIKPEDFRREILQTARNIERKYQD